MPVELERPLSLSFEFGSVIMANRSTAAHSNDNVLTKEDALGVTGPSLPQATTTGEGSSSTSQMSTSSTSPSTTSHNPAMESTMAVNALTKRRSLEGAGFLRASSDQVPLPLSDSTKKSSSTLYKDVASDSTSSSSSSLDDLQQLSLLDDALLHPPRQQRKKLSPKIQIPDCVAKLPQPMQLPAPPPEPPTPPPVAPLPPPVDLPQLEKALSVCTGKHDELTESDRVKALNAFALFESNGRMSVSHLPEALRFLGLRNCLPPVKDEAVATSTISIDKYLLLVRSLRAHKCRVLTEEEQEFKTVFDVLDKDGDGLISIQDLQQIVTDLGLAMKKGEAALLIAKAVEKAKKHRQEQASTSGTLLSLSPSPAMEGPSPLDSAPTAADEQVDHSSAKCIDFEAFAILLRHFQTRADSSLVTNTKSLQAEEELRKSFEKMANLMRTASNSNLEDLEAQDQQETAPVLPKLFSLIDRVRRKIQTFDSIPTPPLLSSDENISGCPLAPVPIHSDYWLECDGLSVYRSTTPLFEGGGGHHQPIEGEEHLENGEEVDPEEEDEVSDTDDDHPSKTEEKKSPTCTTKRKRSTSDLPRRIYSVCLKPYVEKWKTECDPADGQVWQEKLSFRDYFQRYVWNLLPPEKKEEMTEKWAVEYLKRKDLEKNHRVKKADAKGNIVNPATGEVLGPGLWMFVVSANHSRALYVARKIPGKIHHTSLARGRPVACAGMMVIADGTEKIKSMHEGVEVEEQAEPGRLLAILARSGHYKPSEESMLSAVEAFARLKIRLDGTLLVYHEDEASRTFRIGGLQGVALMSKVGGQQDSKVRISTTFLQHLARQELRKVRERASNLRTPNSSTPGSPSISPATSSATVPTSS